MIFKNGFNYILMNALLLGQLQHLTVYSSINCMYIIICARVTAMWAGE